MKTLLSSCFGALFSASLLGAEKQPNFVLILGEGAGWFEPQPHPLTDRSGGWW